MLTSTLCRLLALFCALLASLGVHAGDIGAGAMSRCASMGGGSMGCGAAAAPPGGIPPEAETVTYIARVVADGGTVIDAACVDRWIKHAKANSYLTTLNAWYLGCAGSKRDGANLVAKWYSLVGTADLEQATDANKPLLVAASANLNNKPALRCVGASTDFMAGAALSTYIAAATFTRVSAFYVASAATANTVTYYANDSVVADASGYHWLSVLSTGVIVNGNWDGSQDNAIASSLTIPSAFITQSRHEGGSIYLTVDNGSEQSAASGNTSVLTGLLRLCRSSSTQYLTGDVGMVLYADEALSSGIRSAIVAHANSGPDGYGAF